MQLVDERHRASGQLVRRLELAVPPLELPGDVALVLAEVAETDGVDVDGVDAGEHVGDRLAGPAPAGLVEEGLGGLLVAQHEAVDERHDVERGAVDRFVGAQAERRGHRDVGGRQRRDDPVLAAHVVGGGEHVAERRPPQHEVVAGGAGDAEGEVGVAAGDELERQRPVAPSTFASNHAVTRATSIPLRSPMAGRPW